MKPAADSFVVELGDGQVLVFFHDPRSLARIEPVTTADQPRCGPIIAGEHVLARAARAQSLG